MDRERRAVCRSSGERGPPRRRQIARHEYLAVGTGPHAAADSRSQKLYGVRGTMITAVDLLRGLAALVGWKRIEVPGATGYIDTDYAAKGRYAIDALPQTDLICVHVEATDEASHMGNTADKIKALEEIDRHIVAPAARGLEKAGRLSHSDFPRSSHPDSLENPQPRRGADCDGRHRHPARCGHNLR